MEMSFLSKFTDVPHFSYKKIAEKRLYVCIATKGKESLLDNIVSWKYTWTNKVPGKSESGHVHVTLSPENSPSLLFAIFLPSRWAI